MKAPKQDIQEPLGQMEPPPLITPCLLSVSLGAQATKEQRELTSLLMATAPVDQQLPPNSHGVRGRPHLRALGR